MPHSIKPNRKRPQAPSFNRLYQPVLNMIHKVPALESKGCVNKGIPSKIYFTEGNGAERPFVDQIFSPGQTGIGDRGYQKNKGFDSLQNKGKSFVFRIKENTAKTVISEYETPVNSIVIFGITCAMYYSTPPRNQHKSI